MTLGCLPQYRRLGVGARLLEYILKTAKDDGCARATLHVQAGTQPLLLNLKLKESYPSTKTSNDLALQFYEKAGFSVTGTVPGYYKNIEPADAHVLEKEL